MFFDGNNPIMTLTEVVHMRWEGGTFRIPPRPFAALAFRLSGTATITAGGKTYTVQPSDLVYLPQHLAYTAEYSDTEMLVFHFLTEKDDTAPEIYPIKNSAPIYQAFLQAHTLWTQKDPGYQMHALAQVYTVLGQLCAQQTLANLPPHFLKAVAYIHTHFRDSDLSIPALCTTAGISPSAFRVLFKEQYHRSPLAYITDLRLTYARERIAGGVSVESAAVQSGFRDPKYFARVVKKQYGCTPRDLKTYGK